MKTQHMKLKTYVIAFATLLSTAFSTVATASEGKDTPVVVLKYIGTTNDQPVYQLDLNNIEEDEYTVSIRDRDGATLYSNKFRGKNISVKFQLNTDEITDSRLFVEVKAKNNKKADMYEITRSTRIVQESFVTKLK